MCGDHLEAWEWRVGRVMQDIKTVGDDKAAVHTHVTPLVDLPSLDAPPARQRHHDEVARRRATQGIGDILQPLGGLLVPFGAERGELCERRKAHKDVSSRSDPSGLRRVSSMPTPPTWPLMLLPLPWTRLPSPPPPPRGTAAPLGTAAAAHRERSPGRGCACKREAASRQPRLCGEGGGRKRRGEKL